MITRDDKWFVLDLALFDEAYLIHDLRYLVFFVVLFNAITWTVVLVFYIIVCYILHGEFVVFNEELKEVKFFLFYY
uniref:Uncharacterized protein n=1 Tax=Acrobeloides nanus TaxID=290746 RepID=A0A914ESR3_9BILA